MTSFFPQGQINDFENSKAPFLPFYEKPVVLHRGSIQILVLGYVSPLSDSSKPSPESVQRLQEALAHFGSQVTLTVLLIHAPQAERKQVLGVLHQVDIAIASHTGQLLKDPLVEGHSLVFEADQRGQYLGRIVIHKSDASLSQKNQVPWLRLREELEFLKADGSAEKKPEIERLKRIRQKLVTPSRSWYAHEILPLSDRIRSHPEIEKIPGFWR